MRFIFNSLFKLLFCFSIFFLFNSRSNGECKSHVSNCNSQNEPLNYIDREGGSGDDRENRTKNENTEKTKEEFEVFKRSLEPFFVKNTYNTPNGIKHIIKIEENKPAHKAFKDFCPSEYPHFINNVQSFLKRFEDIFDEDGMRADNKNRIIERIKEIQASCANKILHAFDPKLLEKDEDLWQNYNVYADFNKFINSFKRKKTHALLPIEIRELKQLIAKDTEQLLTKGDSLYSGCIKNREDRKFYKEYGGYKESVFVFGEDKDYNDVEPTKFGKYLNDLGKNDCFQKNKRFNELFEKLEDIGFFNLKENCKQDMGCVKDLRFISTKQLNPSNSNADFFTMLSDKYQESEECCSLDSKECSAGIDKSIEKSLSVKNSEQICKNNSDKAKFNKAKSAAEQVGKLCEKPVNECIKFADEELKKFKQEFLKCFVLPGLDENLNNHVFEECRNDISYIVTNFNENIKSYKNNGGEFIGTPPNNGLSFDTSKFVVDYCKVPLERLKKSAQEVLDNDDEDPGEFKKRVSKLWSKACKKLVKKAEKEADKSDSNTEGASPSIVAGGINYSGSGGSYSGSGGSYSSSTGYSGSNGYSSTAGSGNSDWNRLDPKYFPKKYVPNISGSSDKFSSSSGASDKSSTSSYTGPPDPFKSSYQRRGSAGNHLKVDFGQLFDSSNKKDALAQGEKGYSTSKGKGARSPASSVGGESWASSGSSGRDTGFIRRVFYRGGKDSNRETASDDGENTPYPTVQSVFQVHTKETNLMNRQRELIQTFCKVHQCNYDI